MPSQPAARKSTASKSTVSKSTAAKKTTAKSTTARSIAGRSTRTVAKKAAPPRAGKSRAGLVLTKSGGKTMGARITGPTPYEVRVGGHVVPVVPFRTEALIQMVGSLTGVAELLGVAKSQPTRWRKGEAVPSPEKARLLNDLEHVFSRAALIFEPEVIRDWMTGSNSYLQGARPIDVLRTRGASEVLDALDAAEQLAYGG